MHMWVVVWVYFGSKEGSILRLCEVKSLNKEKSPPKITPLSFYIWRGHIHTNWCLFRLLPNMVWVFSSFGGNHCPFLLLNVGNFISTNLWKLISKSVFLPHSEIHGNSLAGARLGLYMSLSSVAVVEFQRQGGPMCSSCSCWVRGQAAGGTELLLKAVAVLPVPLKIGCWYTNHEPLAVWGVKQFAAHSCHFSSPSMLNWNVWLFERSASVYLAGIYTEYVISTLLILRLP